MPYPLTLVVARGLIALLIFKYGPATHVEDTHSLIYRAWIVLFFVDYGFPHSCYTIYVYS